MNRIFREAASILIMGLVMTMIVTNGSAQTNKVADTSSDNIVIECDDGAEWNFNSGVAIFRGNVRVTDQPNMVLTCELLTAHFGLNTSTNSSTNINAIANSSTNASSSNGLGAVETIEAERNVVIDFASPEGKRHATGDKLVYLAATDIVTLTGNVVLNSPQGGTINSSVVAYDRKNGKIILPGKVKFEPVRKGLEKSFIPQNTNKSK
jgi:lipopolysaccharide export system protein LptA